MVSKEFGWGIGLIILLAALQISLRLSLTNKKIDIGRIQSLIDQIKLILPTTTKGKGIKASYFISENGDRRDKLNRQAVQETLRSHDIERSLLLVRRISLPILVLIIYSMMKFIANSTDLASVHLAETLQDKEKLLFTLDSPLHSVVSFSVVTISLILCYFVYKNYESIRQYCNTLEQLKEDLEKA
jgi:hypothetical protein